MTPRTARRTRPVLVSLSAVAMAAATALPAAAAPNKAVYDALGDSYAAGSGASIAYADVLDGRMKIDLDTFAAVPGARIQTMVDSQLEGLDGDTDLVTITIGGNDIGWGQAITACLAFPDPAPGQPPTPQSCAFVVGQSRAAIQSPAFAAGLSYAYAQVRAAAPNAHVVVTGYPRLFSPEYGAYTVPVSPTFALEVSVAEQHLLNDGADLLNTTIREVAQASGVQFVDVTDKFLGHGVNSPDAYISGVTGADPFHPTDEGQKAYGAALTSQINPRSLR